MPPEVEQRIVNLEIKQAVTDSAIVHLTEQQTRHHNVQIEKMDSIVEKLSKFSCGQHAEKFIGVDKQFENIRSHLTGMWVVISVVFFAILAVGIKAMIGG